VGDFVWLTLETRLETRDVKQKINASAIEKKYTGNGTRQMVESGRRMDILYL
jgi:hypothetical protein